MKNLNRIFSLTLIMLFGALVIVSCDSVNSDSKDDLREERELTAKQIENERNPFDKEGAIHNEFLDYFVVVTAQDTALGREDILNVIENFYSDNNMEFTGHHLEGYLQYFEGLTELGISSPGFPGPIFPTPTDIFCRWFPTLCDIFKPTGPFIPYALNTDALSEENGGTSTERTLKFIEETKILEAEVMADTKMEEDTKAALLSEYAIARYSAAYWHNVNAIQQDESGYYDDFAAADAQALCHVCDVVMTDAAGAALGSFVPVIGTGVGAGVASAAAIFEKIFF